MANGNRWSRIGEAGSKLGEALMQVAMMTLHTVGFMNESLEDYKNN